MNKKLIWITVAIIAICGLAAICIGLNYSKEAQPQNEEIEQEVVSTELIRTSQSWDGVELPDYLEGRPELVAVKYVFPAGKKLGWHHHPVMNYGILTQGELTIIGLDGQEKVVHEGEVVVEMVNTIHHGENRGTKPVVLYMFYLSQQDLPLAVQHPEIPLDRDADFAGVYLDEDNHEPNLFISHRIDGAFDIKIGIYRLTELDDGVGTLSNDSLQFTATDAAGNPIGGTITLEGDTACVTFTTSTWELLESGSQFRYIRKQAD